LPGLLVLGFAGTKAAGDIKGEKALLFLALLHQEAAERQISLGETFCIENSAAVIGDGFVRPMVVLEHFADEVFKLGIFLRMVDSVEEQRAGIIPERNAKRGIEGECEDDARRGSERGFFLPEFLQPFTGPEPGQRYRQADGGEVREAVGTALFAG